MNLEPIDYELIPLRDPQGKILLVGVRIRDKYFLPIRGGVKIMQNGEKDRIIWNSRYENIEESIGLGTREEKAEFTRGFARANRSRLGKV